MSRSRRSQRLVASLASAIVAITVALVGSAVPAAAAPQTIGSCTTSSGVILAVDFSHWGGPLLRSCGTTPTTGYQLLNQGGWHTAGDSHDGPGFICRIAYSGFRGGTGYPTSKQDPCIITPPGSAYWSYWHADPGQNTWSYSHLGAMSYHPKPGSVDLWTFGSTNTAGTEGRPTISPNSVRAHNATPIGGGPKKPTPTPARTATRATSPGSTAHPTHAATTTAPATPGSSDANGTAASATRGCPAAPATMPCPSSADAGVPIENAPPVATAAISHGSFAPTALALVVVLAIVGITLVLRPPRRRR